MPHRAIQHPFNLELAFRFRAAVRTPQRFFSSTTPPSSSPAPQKSDVEARTIDDEAIPGKNSEHDETSVNTPSASFEQETGKSGESTKTLAEARPSAVDAEDRTTTATTTNIPTESPQQTSKNAGEDGAAAADNGESEPPFDDLDEKEGGDDDDETADETQDDGDKEEEVLARTQKRMLRVAEDSLRVESLLSAKNLHKYVYLTEVSTPSGVRWIDVRAKPALWENRVLARQPETEFVAYVTKALHQLPMVSDVLSSIEAGGALPSVQIHESWVCLNLRVSERSLEKIDPYNAAVGLSALSGPNASGGWSAVSEAASRFSATGDDQGAQSLPLPRIRQGRGKKAPHAGKSARDSQEKVNESAEDDDPASHYYYDEDTDQFILLPQSSYSSGDFSLLSRLSLWKMARDNEQRCFSEYKKRKRESERAAYSAMKSPTIVEDTERLSIFLMKEMHPMEEDRESPISADRATSATKIGYMELDEYGNRVFNSLAHYKTKQAEKAAATNAKEATTPSDAASATAAGNGDDKGEKKGMKELPPIKDSKDDPERNLRLRWVVVTIHRRHISFVADMLLRWQEFVTHGGRLLSDDNSDAFQRSFVNSNDVGWEEIVRHLFHEDLRGLQRASVVQTRALDRLETVVFDDSGRSAEQMRRLRNMLRELHLLSRRAKMYTDILKESCIAYKKLKKTVDSPLSASDRKTLSFLDSAVSLSQNLEDQSSSLLALQFSVALNQMERHLRTLTIFSTFFTPLSFIVSLFSMHFQGLEDFCSRENTILLFFGLLVVAALTTSRWITRNVT